MAIPSTKPEVPIVFVESGVDILEWDFLVQGLPAVDTRTGEIIVADLSRGFIASSLGLSILWLRPGENAPVRVWSVLDEPVASTILYERDGNAKQTAALAERVRTRTRETNVMFGTLELRPTISCVVQHISQWCVQPQRLVCSGLSGELQADKLRWRWGAETHETVLGWGIAPMEIGDGPPKEMIPCMDEAHLDLETKRIVAQITTYCKEPGGDACIIPSGWRIISLR